MRTRLISVAVLALLLAACGSSTEISFTRVGATQFASATADPDAILVDLRTPEEHRVGHIAGSRVIDYYADFAGELAELDTSARYLIYCETGARSTNALREMKQLGFRNVVELDGGIQAWTAAELPLVTP